MTLRLDLRSDPQRSRRTTQGGLRRSDTYEHWFGRNVSSHAPAHQSVSINSIYPSADRWLDDLCLSDLEPRLIAKAAASAALTCARISTGRIPTSRRRDTLIDGPFAGSRQRLLILELNAPHALILALSPVALKQVLARDSVQRCAATLASTRQLKMPRGDFFAFVDCRSIVLFVRDSYFGSIDPNLALAFDIDISAVIRSQQ
jgi:hypothetical protein